MKRLHRRGVVSAGANNRKEEGSTDWTCVDDATRSKAFAQLEIGSGGRLDSCYQRAHQWTREWEAAAAAAVNDVLPRHVEAHAAAQLCGHLEVPSLGQSEGGITIIVGLLEGINKVQVVDDVATRSSGCELPRAEDSAEDSSARRRRRVLRSSGGVQ